ncbi:MAG: SGNH/GDSL hydrolase family protein [Planctomycetota bacterium]
MPALGPKYAVRRALTTTALCGTLGLTGLTGLDANAEPITVMAIGDSITWGFDYDPASSGDPGMVETGDSATSFGGWRVPLTNNLANDPRFVQPFVNVGIKGDNSTPGTPTVAGEAGRTSGPPVFDDFGDGISNTTDFLHEGYSGWRIDRSTFGGGPGPDGRDGIFENLVSQGGAINPGAAEVIILSIGVNDLIADSSSSGITGHVNSLDALIDEIKNFNGADDATIIVSNLLPFNDGTTPFDSSTTNADVDAFNAELLNTHFDTMLDIGGNALFDANDLAMHNTYSDVFLLDVNTLFTAAIPDLEDSTFFINAVNNDDLHPTQDGYNALADIYTETFVNLAIGIPEPSSGLLVALGAGLAAARRRRA